VTPSIASHNNPPSRLSEKGAGLNYEDFLLRKSHLDSYDGFEPLWMPDFLYDFQQDITSWAILKGRNAIFADCGLGKTPMQLVWAENIVRKTNKPVLILTPLAVSYQTVKEAEKFNIQCTRSDHGKVFPGINVTNYERLQYFNHADFSGVVCDESSILKNFDGTRKAMITEFMKKLPYRLLCTATAAPNDYIELGTSSEALGYLGFMDMLNMFFKNEQNTSAINRRMAVGGSAVAKWRFKKHAEQSFWKWICSWARAVRKPSDLGYDDGPFVLPELIERQTEVLNTNPLPGQLFVHEAIGLYEQRQELRITLQQRCEKAAEMVNGNSHAVVWCHLNEEGDTLEKLIPDAVQVSGSDSDEKKEEALLGFSSGKIRVLITKPKIAGFGLNWQHCNHMTFFPSHSFEQYYQSVRRCWRFGQKKPVTVDIITTQGGMSVLRNLQRKSQAADKMFSQLVSYMTDALHLQNDTKFNKKTGVPEWLS
jgi:hypothetical protein